ncbi:MAG: RNA polymerase sigma factor [Proteobacteria bacterium]|nr:RNA polymerase sigma factor [Pseudomonadota bacterium]
MTAESNELYEQLLAPVKDQMIRTVTRIVRDPDDAADVFQEVLVVIWHKLDVILQHPNPQGYILRVCITRSYDALRKKLRRQRFEIHLETLKSIFLPNQNRDFENSFSNNNTIQAAISMLPPKQGQAILLRAVDGCEYETIADILECSVSTARSHFSKGKARLEKQLLRLGVVI